MLRDYQCLGLNVIGVDASEKFFADLAGVTDPERKRKIIGADFIEVFDAEAAKISMLAGLHRAQYIPTVSSHFPLQAQSSRATTTWAAYPSA